MLKMWVLILHMYYSIHWLVKKCYVKKLFLCSDNGAFSNDRSCVLLLKDQHFFNIWGYDFMFNDMGTPKIGKKHIRGSCLEYKKLFCLCCMVSYSNDSLHICQGRCHRCLECVDDHTSNYDAEDVICNDCSRHFSQEFCYESHKTKKLSGQFGSYCAFLCTLRNCDKCRQDFSLTVKCKHFGKKRKVIQNVYYSNKAAKVSSGPSKYVKCSYCSDYYMRGFSGGHACYLKWSNSLLGDSSKRSRMIHACNIFFYNIESRLEEKLECQFQVTKGDGSCVTIM